MLPHPCNCIWELLPPIRPDGATAYTDHYPVNTTLTSSAESDVTSGTARLRQLAF
jgi:hypothetical protein